jgi:superfamily I DNA/RNA helicase
VTNLDEFTVKLNEFFTREFEKASYAKLALLEDKMDTMIILIERCKDLGKNDLKSLEDLITSMFSNADDKNVPDIVTLSSIHKAKGLEWNKVFWVGDQQFSPSKYAVQAWQLEQENNLRYVACTRAMTELVHITDCPSRRNIEE